MMAYLDGIPQMPEWDEPFLCGDGVVRQWSEMCDGIVPGLEPQDVQDARLLLWCFDATPIWS